MQPMSSNLMAFSSASRTSAANCFCEIAMRQKPHMSDDSISTGRGEWEPHEIRRVATAAMMLTRMKMPQIHLLAAELLQPGFLQRFDRKQPAVDQNRNPVCKVFDVRQNMGGEHDC